MIPHKLIQLILITCFSILGIIPLAIQLLNPNLSSAKYIVAEAKLTTYVSKNNNFSIQYPSGWFIADDYKDTVIIQNFAPKSSGGGGMSSGAIKTDIVILPQSFKKTTNDFLKFSGITRKGQLAIGGREALRIWSTAKGHGGDIIITIIRYQNNQTFVI